MRVSTIWRILYGTALAVACCMPAAAQQKPIYYSSACVKVKPGQAADFASQVSGTVLKLEEARLEMGAIKGWLALSDVVPAGVVAHCDYLFVTFFPGLPKGPMSESEVTAALHKAGLDLTPKQFWQPIMNDVYLVSSDVGEMPVMIGDGMKGDYDVINYMDMPDTSECVATEQKLWQPVAEARMKAGQQSGWGVWETIFPRGSQWKGTAGTVDVYPSWGAIFNEGLMNTWQEVHPDVKPADAMAQFNKQCKIEMSVVYREVEYIHAPTM